MALLSIPSISREVLALVQVLLADEHEGGRCELRHMPSRLTLSH